MARYTKQDQFTIGGHNDENEKIATAINDTLSRKGDTPNAMEADLDMNSNRIINLPMPVDGQEAASKAYVDLISAVTGQKEFKTPRDFGAVGDGSADDSTAIQQAFDSGSPILIDRTYRFTQNLTANNYITCIGSGKLLYDGAGGSTSDKPLTITSPLFGDINLDCNNKSVQALLLAVQAPNTVLRGGDVLIRNVQTNVNIITTGLVIFNAGEYHLNSFNCYDFTNTIPESSNPSTPQAIVPSSAGVKLYVGKIYSKNCRSVLTTVSDTETYVDSLIVEDCKDNGIYCLGGRIVFGTMSYSGELNEPIVNRGYIKGGEVVAFGRTLEVLRLDGAEYTNIDSIVCKAPEGIDSSTPSTFRTNIPQGVLGHRSGNTTTGEVQIGRISGDVSLSFARMGFSSGITKRLVIDSADLNIWYDFNDTNFDETNWFRITNVEQFNLKPMNIRFIDTLGTAVAGETFESQWSPTKFSTIENFDVSFLNADGTRTTTGATGVVFRGSPQTENLVIDGGYWQTNAFNAYLREQQIGSIRRNQFQGPQIPQSGYWWKGQSFYVDSDEGVVKVRCSLTGTAGSGAEFTLNNLSFVTPEMFGAVGDNVADDTSPVQECFDFAVSSGKSAYLYGTYKTTSSLICDDNLHITGKGTINSTYAPTDSREGAIRIHGKSNVSIEGIKLSHVSDVVGVSIKGSDNISIERMDIETENTEGVATSCVGIYELDTGNIPSSNVRVNNCRLRTPALAVIIQSGAAAGYQEDIIISNNIVENNLVNPVDTSFTTGVIKIDLYARRIVVTGNTCNGNGNVIYFIAAEEAVDNITISDNSITGCEKYGIRLFDGQGGLAFDSITITGNSLVGCGINTTLSALPACDGVTISGNTIINAPERSIDCDFSGSVEGVVISGNSVTDSVGEALFLRSGRSVVSGNFFGSSATYVVSIDSSPRTVLSNNVIKASNSGVNFFDCYECTVGNNHIEAASATTGACLRFVTTQGKNTILGNVFNATGSSTAVLSDPPSVAVSTLVGNQFVNGGVNNLTYFEVSANVGV